MRFILLALVFIGFGFASEQANAQRTAVRRTPFRPLVGPVAVTRQPVAFAAVAPVQAVVVPRRHVVAPLRVQPLLVPQTSFVAPLVGSHLAVRQAFVVPRATATVLNFNAYTPGSAAFVAPVRGSCATLFGF